MPLPGPTNARCLPIQLLGSCFRLLSDTPLFCNRDVTSYHAEAISLFSRCKVAMSGVSAVVEGCCLDAASNCLRSSVILVSWSCACCCALTLSVSLAWKVRFSSSRASVRSAAYFRRVSDASSCFSSS